MKQGGQIVLVLLLLAVGGFVGWHITPECPVVSISERVDTVIVRDTIRLPPPPPEIRYVVRIERDTLRLAGDTVYVTVEVPIERRVYATADYRAEIEGFRPSLISMEVYRQTQYIDRVQTVQVPDTRRWSLGLQAGYGATIHSGRVIMVPTVGVGVGYNLIRW